MTQGLFCNTPNSEREAIPELAIVLRVLRRQTTRYDADVALFNEYGPIAADRLEAAASLEARLAEVTRERDALLHAGAPLANMAFNFAQDQGRTLTSHDCHLLNKHRRQWDAARASRAQGAEG